MTHKNHARFTFQCPEIGLAWGPAPQPSRRDGAAELRPRRRRGLQGPKSTPALAVTAALLSAAIGLSDGAGGPCGKRVLHPGVGPWLSKHQDDNQDPGPVSAPGGHGHTRPHTAAHVCTRPHTAAHGRRHEALTHGVHGASARARPLCGPVAGPATACVVVTLGKETEPAPRLGARVTRAPGKHQETCHPRGEAREGPAWAWGRGPRHGQGRGLDPR